MQGMRLKRFLPLLILAGCFSWSSSVGGLRFIPIYDALVIKAAKNEPPHVAFEEVIQKNKTLDEWSRLEESEPILLGTHQSIQPLYAKRIVLPEMVFTKNSEVIQIANASSSKQEMTESADRPDVSWMDNLPPNQASRIQEAQRRSEVLSQDWSVPTWSDMAKEVLEKSGALAESTKITGNNNPRVYVAGDKKLGAAQNRVPQSSVEWATRRPAPKSSPSEDAPDLPSDDIARSLTDGAERPPSTASLVDTAESDFKKIFGPLEITGGLAVTNEHHIEIRRYDEGVLKELGRVDLSQGMYHIDVSEPTGSVIAQLVDKEGKILGEGSFRLSRLPNPNTLEISGPSLRIEPRLSFAGIITSAYNTRIADSAPAKTTVTFVNGASEVQAKKDGLVSMDNVTKGSTTVMRSAAPGYLQTASIIVSGSEFKAQLYPSAMIEALQEIVSQQRMMSIEGIPTVIWGRTSRDGKNVAGVTVQIEGNDSLRAIYFDSFLIPNSKLTATSENGLFAFVDVSPDFHSLIAMEGEKLFGFQNVVAEENSVAFGEIENSLRQDAVSVRIYDAFSGESHPAMFTIQSLLKNIAADEGQITLTLPHVNRAGYIRVTPPEADFLQAQYVYNDSDDFIHIPLVRRSWLLALKGYLKIDDQPENGIVVGFVPDENFEVYLAGHDDFDQRNIVYFDMQGRILQNKKGISGGGFILYNVPDDTHEVVVLGQRTQKMYSKVLPVESNTLSVLTFRE